jgi:hypothetical protein
MSSLYLIFASSLMALLIEIGDKIYMDRKLNRLFSVEDEAKQHICIIQNLCSHFFNHS